MTSTTARDTALLRESRPRAPHDLRDFWRSTLAAVAPLPGLALAAGILLAPYAVDADFPATLRGVAGDPGREHLAQWVGLVFTLTCLPAVIAVVWAVRRGAPRLALVGGLLAFTGFGFGLALPDTGAAALVAVQEHLDPTKAAAIEKAAGSHAVTVVAVVVFLVGTTVGLLLLGIGLWRSGGAPRWTAAVLAASGPAHLLAPGGTAGAAAAWALTGVGCAGASVALLRTRADDFDLAPLRPGEQAAPAVPTTRDARTVWRVLLAVATPLTALYVAVFRFLLPYDGTDAPRQIFDKLVAHPGFDNVNAWFGTFLAPTCVAGVLAVAWVSRRRAPRLTTVGLLLAFVGFTCLFANGSGGGLIPQTVAGHPGLDIETAYRLGNGLEMSALSTTIGSLFVLGHLVGTVVLGIAMWRSRVVPSWIAIALAVSQPIHLASVLTGNRPLDLVGWGATALGFAAAGWVLLRMTDDEFDLPPLAH